MNLMTLITNYCGLNNISLLPINYTAYLYQKEWGPLKEAKRSLSDVLNIFACCKHTDFDLT